MKGNKKKGPNIPDLKEFNTKRILGEEFRPIPLNLKLLSNPFLKDQEKFHYIIFRLNDYNRRISQETAKDPYQSMVFEKLHTIMRDISHFQTKEDQISRLQQTFSWFKGQQKLIQQRKEQGQVRYQITKQVRNGVEVEEKQKIKSEKSTKDEIPFSKVNRQMKPFKKKWRTIHKDLDAPKKRLKDYKRKIINIVPFIEQKEEKKAPRILYPKIQKFQKEQEEDKQEKEEGEEGQQKKQGEQNPENKEEEKKEQENENQGQDLGGFGEEPQQPQQNDEPIDEDGDKLAPKLKNYTIEWDDIKRKQYKEGYLFYRGSEIQTERKMEKKYVKIQQRKMKSQNQDNATISYMNDRGAAKSKLQKQIQKRLEIFKFRPKYSFMEEKDPLTERLSPQEQEKFGLTMDLKKNKKKGIAVDFSLPKINPDEQKYSKFEKNYRKDRLKFLRTRFSNLLDLKQLEERNVSPTLCQTTARRRQFSQLLRDHSHSKERLRQLDEVDDIKKRINQSKQTLDLKTLAKGLCEPEQQKYNSENIIPLKDLPSNPFMVEPKKKKK